MTEFDESDVSAVPNRISSENVGDDESSYSAATMMLIELAMMKSHGSANMWKQIACAFDEDIRYVRPAWSFSQRSAFGIALDLIKAPTVADTADVEDISILCWSEEQRAQLRLYSNVGPGWVTAGARLGDGWGPAG